MKERERERLFFFSVETVSFLLILFLLARSRGIGALLLVCLSIPSAFPPRSDTMALRHAASALAEVVLTRSVGASCR